MWQSIVVFAIGVVAVILAGRYIVRSIKHPESGCAGCSQDCSACHLSDKNQRADSNKEHH